MNALPNVFFQHRAVDEDGFQIIAVGDLAITEHLSLDRNLVFGSWTPGHFDQITTLTFNAAGAVITGVRSSRVIPRDQFGGDPDGLLVAWHEATDLDEKHERQRRVDALAKRDEQERRFYTTAKIDDRRVPAYAEIEIRMLLQFKQPLTYANWDPATGEMKAPIAILLWEGAAKRTVRFQSMIADHSLIFDDVPDLDRVANAWMKFIDREREVFEFAALFTKAEAEVKAKRENAEMGRRADKYRLPDDQVDHSSNVEWNGYTEPFRAFAIALTALCPNFSDNDVARALDDGLTPEQAADDLNRDHRETVAAEKHDFEQQIIHDHSMDH